MGVIGWQSGLKVTVVIKQTRPPATGRYLAFCGQEPGEERHGVF